MRRDRFAFTASSASPTSSTSFHLPTILVASTHKAAVTESNHSTFTATAIASPLAVQVLRVRKEEKESAAVTSLKKERFVYEIETCHDVTGDVFRAERRFREFKQLREALLHETQHCSACRPFYEQLRAAKLPSRQLLVRDQHKYAAQRVLLLSHFLRDLVALASVHTRQCAANGRDIDTSVGLFLGLPSLAHAEKLAASQDELLPPPKTRQERMDFRAASMPDFRFSSSSSLQPSDEVLATHRRRGFSEC